MSEREEWARGELRWLADGLCIADFESEVKAFGLEAVLSVLKDEIMRIAEALEDDEWEE